jgi:hypothetical protein
MSWTRTTSAMSPSRHTCPDQEACQDNIINTYYRMGLEYDCDEDGRSECPRPRSGWKHRLTRASERRINPRTRDLGQRIELFKQKFGYCCERLPQRTFCPETSLGVMS